MAMMKTTPVVSTVLDRYRLQAISCIGLANAVHIGSYELARSATTTLFTSDTIGFQSSSAITFATGLVSPFSIILLWFHRRVFDTYGPRWALRGTCLVYAALFLTAHLLLQQQPSISVSQTTILLLFIAKNSFVHLLMAQHGSFLTTVLPSQRLAEWSSIVAGVASVASTLAAWSLSPLISKLKWSLTGLLCLASGGILVTLVLGEMAYHVADTHKFAPHVKDIIRTSTGKKWSTTQNSLPYRAMELFRRVPVLGALCSEVLVCQSLSSLMSYLFITTVKAKIPNDRERAKYTGSMYARINLSTTLLQFGAIPLFLSQFPSCRTWLWIVMPIIVLIPSAAMMMVSDKTTTIVPVAFGVLKTLEYSLRGTLAEVVYGTMDQNSRFFGKEVISLFANRLGKSGTALLLASIPTFHLIYAPQLLVTYSVLWLLMSYRLVQLLQVKQKEN